MPGEVVCRRQVVLYRKRKRYEREIRGTNHVVGVESERLLLIYYVDYIFSLQLGIESTTFNRYMYSTFNIPNSPVVQYYTYM